ncbi:hypothetical protein EJB05_38335, partial [Eragrostis curvula]
MLEIYYCSRITKLPEQGLPSSLEELYIRGCSKELAEQCRMLATSKLKVKNDYRKQTRNFCAIMFGEKYQDTMY